MKHRITPEQHARILAWLSMLESRELKQAEGGLRIVDTGDVEVGYCCLGVACLLYQSEVGGLWGSQMAGSTVWGSRDNFIPDFTKHNYPKHASESYLPIEVSDWLGLPPDYQRSLARMNDGGMSFPKIAEEVRRWLSHDVEVI